MSSNKKLLPLLMGNLERTLTWAILFLRQIALDRDFNLIFRFRLSKTIKIQRLKNPQTKVTNAAKASWKENTI